jgi:hypothetical protein
MRRLGWVGWLALTALAGPATARAQGLVDEPLAHEFYFTRGIYSGASDGDDWGPRWAIDYPEADRHFLVALRRLTGIDAGDAENAVPIGAPMLREYPFVYVLEVGALRLSDAEIEALRHYLLAGGFLVVDDFWGTWAWENLEAEMRRVFPGRPIVELPLEHPVFHAFYDVRELLQVPNVYQAGSGRTHEYDGHVPHTRGILDDQGRLMVLINWNTDLGDAWEWADDPEYPLRYSTYAYELGINFVIYAMSH